jgi:hypothetical protein
MESGRGTMSGEPLPRRIPRLQQVGKLALSQSHEGLGLEGGAILLIK